VHIYEYSSGADIGRTGGSPIETLVWDPRANDIRVV